MGGSILRRLVLVVITILEGGLVSATLVRYAPGFGADERQLDARLSSDSMQAIQHANAGDRNILHFYFSSLRKTLGGDLGISRSLNRPVRQLLQERAAVTTVSRRQGPGCGLVGGDCDRIRQLVPAHAGAADSPHAFQRDLALPAGGCAGAAGHTPEPACLSGHRPHRVSQSASLSRQSGRGHRVACRT